MSLLLMPDRTLVLLTPTLLVDVIGMYRSLSHSELLATALKTLSLAPRVMALSGPLAENLFRSEFGLFVPLCRISSIAERTTAFLRSGSSMLALSL